MRKKISVVSGTGFAAAALAIGSLTVGPPAYAQAPAVTLSDTVGNVTNGNDRTLGWAFTVNVPVTVTALGVFDSAQDGLGESHNVGIFVQGSGGSGPLLTSAVVPAGTGATLVNKFRYVTIAPFVLNPGTTYDIGAQFSGSGPDSQVQTASGFSNDSRVNYAFPVTNTGGFNDPNQTLAGSPGRFGPNFLILQNTPEPGSVALLMGLSISGGLFLKRRRK